MSTQELERRLNAAQKSIARALSTGDTDALPGLVADREEDIRELTVRVRGDEELSRWTHDYLERDRNIMLSAEAARDQVTARLLEIQRTKSVHRLYLSEGIRR